MRNSTVCICENKDADQLRGNREADQRLCFRYIDSTIPILSKSEIASLQPFSVAVQPGLCGTWSETPKTGFLTTRLVYFFLYLLIICSNMVSFSSIRAIHTCMLTSVETTRDRKRTIKVLISLRR